MRLHAFAYPGSPPQTVTISTARGRCGPLAAAPDWQTVECTLNTDAWRTGVNQLTLKFAYSMRPADVGAGGDLRSLAAAVDWIRVSVAGE